MITAVDSNVVVDFLNHDLQFGTAALESLRSCAAEGRLVVCDVVWAEIAGCFPSVSACRAMLLDLEIGFSAVQEDAAFEAGSAWAAYRRRGGPRARVIADFLVGAHALHQADRLLTRDRGFYRAYFKRLHILDPAKLRT